MLGKTPPWREELTIGIGSGEGEERGGRAPSIDLGSEGDTARGVIVPLELDGEGGKAKTSTTGGRISSSWALHNPQEKTALATAPAAPQHSLKAPSHSVVTNLSKGSLLEVHLAKVVATHPRLSRTTPSTGAATITQREPIALGVPRIDLLKQPSFLPG
ncbi:MAG: hypothetical protein JSR76_07500 [Verrucomicrobia bacterium]|nr:hypothetical protein [Verrucomicrobiota bacterium]